MKYINVFSSFLLFLSGIRFKYDSKSKKKRWIDSFLQQLSEDWLKIDVDASRKLITRTTFISYIMRNNHANIVKAKENELRIPNCGS